MRQYLLDPYVQLAIMTVVFGSGFLVAKAAATATIRYVRAWRNQPVVLSDYCQQLLTYFDPKDLDQWESFNYGYRRRVYGWVLLVNNPSRYWPDFANECVSKYLTTSADRKAVTQASQVLWKLLADKNKLVNENQARDRLGLPPKTQL